MDQISTNELEEWQTETRSISGYFLRKCMHSTQPSQKKLKKRRQKGAGYKDVNSRFGSQAQMNKKNGKRPRKDTNSHGKDIRVSYMN